MLRTERNNNIKPSHMCLITDSDSSDGLPLPLVGLATAAVAGALYLRAMYRLKTLRSIANLSQKCWNDSPCLYRSDSEVHESAYRLRRAAFAGVSQLVLVRRLRSDVSRNNSPARRACNASPLLAVMSAGGLLPVRSIAIFCCLLFAFFFGRPLFFFFLGRPRFAGLAK